jgi:DNA-directed RNA polymerase specialized sigma24 family protein
MMSLVPAAQDVLRYATRAAARFSARMDADHEDVAQRVMLAVSADIRDGRAPWAVIVVSIRHALAGIVRHDRAARRYSNLPTVSAHSGIASRDRISDQEQVELRHDIDLCLSRESPEVRRLCALLESMTLTQAARVMGVPRATLRGWLASLRERMEAKGLGGG